MGSQLPCIWDEELCKAAAEQRQLELLKWMRAQRPPCSCDFETCLCLAEDEGVYTYFQISINLLDMCSDYSPHPSTNTTNGAILAAEAMSLIDQGAGVIMEDYAGNTLLHKACEKGLVEVTKALLKKGADVHAKSYDRFTTGWRPLH